ncbi:unnamed protein product [Pedinophyceae sp. YPF-701]|nr:unnamed protein product [Pedinophyceae sp. YPF-701]
MTVPQRLKGGSALCIDTDLSDEKAGLWKVGAKVLCSASFDNRDRLAEVVERKVGDDGGMNYYVHYVDCDKRLDEWVSEDRVRAYDPKGVATELVSPIASDLMSPTGETQQKLTRRLKRRIEEVHHVQKGIDELPPLDRHLEKEHHEKTKVKNIHKVELGRHELDTWYFSPYPAPYSDCHKLYVCEFCLKYFRKCRTYSQHCSKCAHRAPPGKQVYLGSKSENSNGEQIAFYEVDGADAKVYCQNLCLLSKLFLDHKTLYFDVEHFLFYVMCEVDAKGAHIVGYFSKEKHSLEDFNLACILTLPSHQRKGYGRGLISFSYELSKAEGKPGTPERPLSDLGLVSYRSYWLRALLETLKEHRGHMTVRDLSRATCIKPDDVVTTLQSVNLCKYWKGQHIISATPRIIDEHLRTFEHQKGVQIVRSKLHWRPRQWPHPDHLAKKARTKPSK